MENFAINLDYWYVFRGQVDAIHLALDSLLSKDVGYNYTVHVFKTPARDLSSLIKQLGGVIEPYDFGVSEDGNSMKQTPPPRGNYKWSTKGIDLKGCLLCAVTPVYGGCRCRLLHVTVNRTCLEHTRVQVSYESGYRGDRVQCLFVSTTFKLATSTHGCTMHLGKKYLHSKS